MPRALPPAGAPWQDTFVYFMCETKFTVLRPLLWWQGKNMSQGDVETALERAQSEAAVLLDRQNSQCGASTSAKRDMPSITADAAAFHNISRSGNDSPEAASAAAHCCPRHMYLLKTGLRC